MIGSLRGKILELEGRNLIVEVGGVGYEVEVTNSHSKVVGEEVFLFIHTEMRQDALLLFGFDSLLERNTFRLLLRVNGVGTRTALDILSSTEPKALLQTIASGDVTALTRLKGIGKKTAERLVLELREKVLEHQSPVSSAVSDAVLALLSLGIPRKEAEKAVEQAKGEDVSEIVREALRYI
jgi:Holliday junction DNA helicase RuvA